MSFLGKNIFIFLFGLAIGSFLNVVIYRLNHNLNPLKGRSFCPKCKKKIAWFDNIPLLSFFFLRGRCRHCRKPISWQYPLVELTAGLLSVLTFRLGITLGLGFTVYALVLTWGLITIFVSDLRYETIPDEVSLSLILLSLVYQFGHWSAYLSGLVSALVFLLLVLTTRGRGMGLGDVKLAGLMGLVLSYPKILVAMMLAFLTGAIVGVILILIGKKRFGQHIPFGPFLAAATWISLFWGERIVIFYFSLMGL